MKIVLQRVTRAHVRVEGAVVGAINRGILVLLGVQNGDTRTEADFLAAKCAGLRIFDDSEGKMNLSLTETGGAALVISQFTLLADCRKGRRPSFTGAAPPEQGKELYEYFVSKLRGLVKDVRTGVFGAMMEVELVNDGPVTFVLDTKA